MQSIADMLREEGMEEKNLKIIRNALNAGVEIDTICQITGLSKDKVEKLIEEVER